MLWLSSSTASTLAQEDGSSLSASRIFLAASLCVASVPSFGQPSPRPRKGIVPPFHRLFRFRLVSFSHARRLAHLFLPSCVVERLHRSFQQLHVQGRTGVQQDVRLLHAIRAKRTRVSEPKHESDGSEDRQMPSSCFASASRTSGRPNPPIPQSGVRSTDEPRIRGSHPREKGGRTEEHVGSCP